MTKAVSVNGIATHDMYILLTPLYVVWLYINKQV